MIYDLNTLSEDSKVWIYQADREFIDAEPDVLNKMITDFLKKWNSHSSMLSTFGKLYHNRFVALFVDETNIGASGCSIDSSVNFIKEIEQYFGVSLLGRDQVAYLEDDLVKTMALDNLENAVLDGQITEDTLVFDNLVKTKEEFLLNWIKPIKQSWHRKFI